MELDAYTRAALAHLQAEGFTPASVPLAPPGEADFSLPLLGCATPEGVFYLALVPGAGRLTPKQRQSTARAWAAWAQHSVGTGAAPLRLALVFCFSGEVDARLQGELRSLAAAGPGWELAVWVADPTVRFLGTHPPAADATPGLRALAAAGEAVGHTPNLGEGRRRLPRPPGFTPWLTYALLVVCAGLYILITLTNRDLNATSDLSTMVSWGAQYGPWIWEGEHWRLLTSIFLHWGIIHLAMNGYALYLLGWQVEYLFGRWRYLIIFFVAGIAGNVLSLFLLDPYVPSAGASGAIFGLLGAFLYLKVGTPLGARMRWRPLLEVLAINAVISFLPGIDLWGHLGGFLGGLAASAIAGLPGAPQQRLRTAAGALLLVGSLLLCTSLVPLGPRGVAAFSAGLRDSDAGDYGAAIAAYQRAIAANPGVGRYHLRLGEAYYKAGDLTRALDEVAQALRLAPEDGQAEDYLAQLRRLPAGEAGGEGHRPPVR